MNVFLAIIIALILPVSIGHSVELAINHPRAKLNYQLYCQGCHTPSGKGGMGVPSLFNQVGYFLKTAHGRSYLMQVPGVSYSVLDDKALSEVMNWLIVRYAGDSMPTTWSPYTETETARYRQTPLMKINPLRSYLLKQGMDAQ